MIFSAKQNAIFHGDPADRGNVYHLTGDPKNPYMIALFVGTDGDFPTSGPDSFLMQLILGVESGDAKRLHEYVGALLDSGLPTDPEKVRKSMP